MIDFMLHYFIGALFAFMMKMKMRMPNVAIVLLVFMVTEHREMMQALVNGQSDYNLFDAWVWTVGAITGLMVRQMLVELKEAGKR